MSRALKLSLLLFTQLIAFSASGQVGRSPSNLPLPLVEAVRKAVGTNPEVQARWNAFMAADSQRDMAKAGYLPQIDLRASVGSESRVTAGVSTGSYDLSSAQLTLNQILFDGFFTRSEVNRLSAARLTRYYELLEISETTALEAAKAYADVVRFRELVELATQNYVEHKQSALLVEERADAGVGRRVDVEQANGRLALAESNLLTELTNLHDVSARYLRVVGETPSASLPALPEPFTLGEMPASADRLLREGLRLSPTLLAAVENARSYRLAIATTKAGYMPRVDFQLYSTQGYNTGGVLGDSQIQGASIALTYNLFRGGADRAREKQAVSLADEARDLQEKTCRDVRQTLSLAFSDVRALNEQLGFIDQHRLSTEKTREAYRQQFDIGQRTLLDLLDTQNEFFEASRSYINARHNQAIAQARTLSAMGLLVSSVGVHRADMPDPDALGAQPGGVSPEDICPLEETAMDSLQKIKADVAPPPPAKAVLGPVGACGRITLLPDDDGKVGRVFVKGDKGGEVKLDKAYASSLDGCNTVEPIQSSAEEVAQVFTAPMEQLPPKARYYRINFVLGKDKWVPQSNAVFKSMLEDYRQSGTPEVTVVGHTDRLGRPDTNLELSRRRAKSVVNKLVGTAAARAVNVAPAWRGDKEPLPGTEAAKIEPRNRRVDIRIQ